MPSLSLYQGELNKADVQVLLALHVRAMTTASPPDACHVLPGNALDQPSITVFTARENGRLVGMGALRELSVDDAEIKSMRTVPEALGRGVGRAVLGHLIEAAMARGYRRLCLETGTTPEFTPALRMYDRAGFKRCEPFGGYLASPFTRFLSLEL